jgi:lipopolysaccharide heptosyltransferase I
MNCNETLEPRILVIKLSSLGDIIHALPAVHAIKNGLNARIDWAVHPQFAELVACFKDVSGLLLYPRNDWFRQIYKTICALRTVRYDYVLDLQGLLKSAILCKMAAGKKSIGHSFSREGARFFYKERAGSSDLGRHAVERYYDFVSYFKLPYSSPQFPIALPEIKLAKSKPTVGLLPFSRWGSKTWPLHFFVRLANDLHYNFGADIALFGAKNEESLASEFAKEFKGTFFNNVGKLSLPELAAWLAGMDVVIGNDSGTIHLAAAVGTPVIALFGPTDPIRTAPYGANHKVISAELHCQPCFRKKCRFKDHSCMQAITPEMVLSEIIPLLKSAKNGMKKTG